VARFHLGRVGVGVPEDVGDCGAGAPVGDETGLNPWQGCVVGCVSRAGRRYFGARGYGVVGLKRPEGSTWVGGGLWLRIGGEGQTGSICFMRGFRMPVVRCGFR
jgi:hypothetical protein